jgi:microcystin-dependent protein
MLKNIIFIVILSAIITGILYVFYPDLFILKTSKPIAAASRLSNAATDVVKDRFLISSDDEGNLYNTSLIVHQICPVGTIMLWSTDVAPDGWLLCDGKEYISTEEKYKNLYAVIKNTYGGTGANFKVPDLKGRFPLGFGQGAGLTNRKIADTGGVETVTLDVSQIPKHSHNWNNGNWGLMYQDGHVTYSGKSDYTEHEPNLVQTPLKNFNVSEVGGGQAHNNMPPFLVLNFIIKY